MGHHCCSKQKVKRGLWSPEEDEKLIHYIITHGHGCWSSVPKLAGLQRCGKSCRLRWINYLRPDLKRGTFTAQEERVIIDVHRILGNRWAQIAKHLPGRTDNEVKNFWNSCIKKKLMAQGLDPKTHNLIPATRPSNNNSSNMNHSHSNSAATTVAVAPFTISSNTIKSNRNSTDNILPPPPVTILPSYPNVDPTGFERRNTTDHNLSEYDNCSEFMDEPCFWDGNVDVGPSEVPNSNEAMEMSYNSSPFDLELMESALMPCGVISGGSFMEQLQWDC